MKYALYLGCVIPNRYAGIEAATRKVLQALGIELVDMNGATCCPAPGVIRSFDKDVWLVTAARNLTIAEQLRLDIITMCNGCYATLVEANHILKTDSQAKSMVNEVLSKIGRKFEGKINVKHLTEVLYFDVGVEKISKAIKRKLSARAATFYGCHLMKPSELRPWGTVERPTFLDEMVEALGMESVQYRDKMMCCGAGGALRSGVLDVSLEIARERLAAMKEAGVECIVDVCPFCHLQFDVGQTQIAQKWSEKFNIPVFYYTQLLGLAMGFTPEEMGIQFNVIDSKPFLNRILKG